MAKWQVTFLAFTVLILLTSSSAGPARRLQAREKRHELAKRQVESAEQEVESSEREERAPYFEVDPEEILEPFNPVIKTRHLIRHDRIEEEEDIEGDVEDEVKEEE